MKLYMGIYTYFYVYYYNIPAAPVSLLTSLATLPYQTGREPPAVLRPPGVEGFLWGVGVKKEWLDLIYMYTYAYK